MVWVTTLAAIGGLVERRASEETVDAMEGVVGETPLRLRRRDEAARKEETTAGGDGGELKGRGGTEGATGVSDGEDTVSGVEVEVSAVLFRKAQTTSTLKARPSAMLRATSVKHGHAAVVCSSSSDAMVETGGTDKQGVSALTRRCLFPSNRKQACRLKSPDQRMTRRNDLTSQRQPRVSVCRASRARRGHSGN